MKTRQMKMMTLKMQTTKTIVVSPLQLCILAAHKKHDYNNMADYRAIVVCEFTQVRGGHVWWWMGGVRMGSNDGGRPPCTQPNSPRRC